MDTIWMNRGQFEQVLCVCPAAVAGSCRVTSWDMELQLQRIQRPGGSHESDTPLVTASPIAIVRNSDKAPGSGPGLFPSDPPCTRGRSASTFVADMIYRG